MEQGRRRRRFARDPSRRGSARRRAQVSLSLEPRDEREPSCAVSSEISDLQEKAVQTSELKWHLPALDTAVPSFTSLAPLVKPPTSHERFVETSLGRHRSSSSSPTVLGRRGALFLLLDEQDVLIDCFQRQRERRQCQPRSA